MKSGGTWMRRGTGLVLVGLGLLWMLNNVVDVDLAWRWILPGLLVLWGALLVWRAGGPSSGAPPSQFERDDSPRVP